MSSAHFATTHWSLVLAARDRAEPGAADALASLCSLFWYPLYAPWPPDSKALRTQARELYRK